MEFTRETIAEFMQCAQTLNSKKWQKEFGARNSTRILVWLDEIGVTDRNNKSHRRIFKFDLNTTLNIILEAFKEPPRKYEGTQRVFDSRAYANWLVLNDPLNIMTGGFFTKYELQASFALGLILSGFEAKNDKEWIMFYDGVWYSLNKSGYVFEEYNLVIPTSLSRLSNENYAAQFGGISKLEVL